MAFVLISSAIRGARGHDGIRPQPAPPEEVTQEAMRGCLADMESLQGELRKRLDAVFAATPARRSSEQEWETWSPAWRARLLQISARCRLEEGDVPEARPLREAYKNLVGVHRLYTTLSVQFAQGIGPTIDQLNLSMEKARAALGAQQPEAAADDN